MLHVNTVCACAIPFGYSFNMRRNVYMYDVRKHTWDIIFVYIYECVVMHTMSANTRDLMFSEQSERLVLVELSYLSEQSHVSNANRSHNMGGRYTTICSYDV